MNWSHTRGPLFHHYEIHKNSGQDFEPSQKTLLGTPTLPAFIEPHPADQGYIFYKVAAVDSWGNRSSISEPATVTKPASAPPRKCLVDLAKSHLTGSLTVNQAADAVGGQCVVFDSSSKEGAVQLPLSLPAGRYLVWARVKSKGRYQTARLELMHGGQKQKCLVIGVSRNLFSEPMWSWKHLMTVSRYSVPRRVPTAIEVKKRPTTLTLRYLSGYVEIDQLFLTPNVHDLPAPEALEFKPEDKYRFR